MHADGSQSFLVSEWRKPREMPRPLIKCIEEIGKVCFFYLSFSFQSQTLVSYKLTLFLTCQGAFGVVHKAIVDESTTIGLPSYLAAVKEFKNPTEAEKRAIFLEASIMTQLSHEHVVRLVRCSSHQNIA